MCWMHLLGALWFVLDEYEFNSHSDVQIDASKRRRIQKNKIDSSLCNIYGDAISQMRKDPQNFWQAYPLACSFEFNHSTNRMVEQFRNHNSLIVQQFLKSCLVPSQLNLNTANCFNILSVNEKSNKINQNTPHENNAVETVLANTSKKTNYVPTMFSTNTTSRTQNVPTHPPIRSILSSTESRKIQPKSITNDTAAKKYQAKRKSNTTKSYVFTVISSYVKLLFFGFAD